MERAAASDRPRVGDVTHRDDNLSKLPWRDRPREPLRLIHQPHLALGAVFILIFLVLGGGMTLAGIADGSRLLGFLGVVTGLALTAILIVYLRRPVRARRPEPRLRDDLRKLKELLLRKDRH